MTAVAARAVDPDAVVEAIVRDAGSSFYWGMRILPRERRRAIYAVYALCRTVDDIADEPGDPTERQSRLDDWRAELECLYAGARPRHAVARALMPAIRRFELPRAEFDALIDGMESDLHGRNVAPTMEAFRLYCRRVAGSVGLLSIRCFGAREPEAELLAVCLGEALQTTNILRDLGEDAAAGRLYLPAELLARNGVVARTPDTVLDDPGLPGVCRDLAAHARDRYARARSLIERCDRRPMRPVVQMMLRYEALLMRLESAGWREPRRRIVLPKWQSVLLLRHLIL